MNWLRMGAMVLAGALMIGLGAGPAAAGVPTDQLKGAVERVLKTLDDPALRGNQNDRRAAVRRIANEIFDFNEIAKRSLARHWQPLSEAQRAEFVSLFADLLERSYISKIETYGGEKIQYTAERADGDPAVGHPTVALERRVVQRLEDPLHRALELVGGHSRRGGRRAHPGHQRAHQHHRPHAKPVHRILPWRSG